MIYMSIVLIQFHMMTQILNYLMKLKIYKYINTYKSVSEMIDNEYLLNINNLIPPFYK